jgi:hypothetical protein
MTKYKVAELEGAPLDAAVALVEGNAQAELQPWTARYSTDWQFGGPVIEREGIELWPDSANDIKDSEPGVWFAHAWQAEKEFDGPTPLIAAMRAYVASKFGEEVELP